MAKESRLKNLIYSGYRNGFWQSMLLHELFFIALALIILKTPIKPDPIIITFSTSTEHEILHETPVLSLDFDQSGTPVENFHKSDALLSLLDNTEIDVPSIGSVVITNDNPNSNLSLLDNDLDLNQIISHDEQPETTALEASHVSASSRSPNPANNRLSNFRQMLSDGSSLADNIPDHGLNGLNQNNSVDYRLNMYGAKTGDVQVSLIWNTADDIDLHVKCDSNNQTETIWFMNRYGRSGGILDIDMNASGPTSNMPIENIYWPYNRSPSATYTVGVHFFRSWTGNRRVRVMVRIKTLKGTHFETATLVLGQPMTIVASFSN